MGEPFVPRVEEPPPRSLRRDSMLVRIEFVRSQGGAWCLIGEYANRNGSHAMRSIYATKFPDVEFRSVPGNPSKLYARLKTEGNP